MNPGSNVADGSDRAQTSNLEALRATGAIPKNYAGISGSDPVGSRGGVKSVDNGNRLPDSGPRKSCRFGKICYRQNLHHFLVESHPWDEDYIPDEDGDERPECTFGLLCYRRNPEHKAKYKHTRKPGEERRSVVSALPANSALVARKVDQTLPTRKDFSPNFCRYCGEFSSPDKTPVLHGVCKDKDCQENFKLSCSKYNSCGHPCGGIKGERVCLPCLQGCSQGTKQNQTDDCSICLTFGLYPIPSILLTCGHVFHFSCVRNLLKARWPGARIGFGFSQCPICKVEINHPSLNNILKPIRELRDDVKKKAVMRLKHEGLDKCESLTKHGSVWFNDPAGFAMDRYAYYNCSKCGKAYCGGEARCEQILGVDNNFDPKDLLCGSCSDVSNTQRCPRHGVEFLEFKCCYCCSIAVFFCGGRTHFCNRCHNDAGRLWGGSRSGLPSCSGGTSCPLKVKHPVAGQEFTLGCGLCRNHQEF